MENSLEMRFLSLSENEAFARNAVAAFIVGLNPTVEQINDVKTAVSEAVTNCIVHGYDGKTGSVFIKVEIEGRVVAVTISDNGVGISDIEKARQPFFTTKAEEDRSGMGFTIMECLMDSLSVTSDDLGTTLIMRKEIGC